MEFYVICPYYIGEKNGYITKKDKYTQIYLECREEIDLRDLIYSYDFDSVLNEKF